MPKYRVIPLARLVNGSYYPHSGNINSAISAPIFPHHIPYNIRKMVQIKRFLLKNDVESALNELKSINANMEV